MANAEPLNRAWDALLSSTDDWVARQQIPRVPWNETAEGPEPYTRTSPATTEPESTEEGEHLAADLPLLDAARQRPAETVHFLEVVLVSGSALGLVMIIPIGMFFLSESWAACGWCNRPLHIWLLAHLFLQLVQVPFRTALYLKLRSDRDEHDDLEGLVRTVTCSRIWKTSTVLSTAGYAWFVVGVVWMLNVKSCTSCPDLYRLTMGTMAVAIAKPIFTMLAFRHLFGSAIEAAFEEERPAPLGATEKTISKLPLEEHPYEQLLLEGQTSCAVCLCEFEGGEMLRRLPCGHKFHSPCVDAWLRRNKRCPLCIHDVDVPVPSRWAAGARRAFVDRIVGMLAKSKKA